MKVDTNLTVAEAFDGFMKKCTIKNHSPETLKTFKVHYHVAAMDL